MSMTLLSVNRALPEATVLADRSFFTAIAKEPTTEQVAVGELGLDGDGVGSPQHHGGPDQAVYVYGADDYEWWNDELGQALSPGMFGENLTIEGFRSAELTIGDRLAVGDDLVLEISAPRIPCGTLAARMLDGAFAKKFRAAQRPGAYTRVIATGTVQAGDQVVLIPAEQRDFTLLDMFNLFYDRNAPATAFEQGLRAPIAERARVEYQRLADR
jgi:MOSC domain-containing protein YiiM